MRRRPVAGTLGTGALGHLCGDRSVGYTLWRSLWRVDVVPARHQNARLFAIGVILEVDLVGAF